jgi:hypothetical protein
MIIKGGRYERNDEGDSDSEAAPCCHRHRDPPASFLRSVGTSTLPVSSEPMHHRKRLQDLRHRPCVGGADQVKKNWDSGSVQEVSGDLCFKLDPTARELDLLTCTQRNNLPEVARTQVPVNVDPSPDSVVGRGWSSRLQTRVSV